MLNKISKLKHEIRKNCLFCYYEFENEVKKLLNDKAALILGY